jgi:hypothetical protein
VDESTRECTVRWLVPAPPNAGCKYTEHTATARRIDEVFRFFARAEDEVYDPWGVVSAVCLDDPSGYCLYVGSAGDRWSLYYLRMPYVGDGETSARCVGDLTAQGTTEVIEEMAFEVANSRFVHRAAGEQAVREWWWSKSLCGDIHWHWEESPKP